MSPTTNQIVKKKKTLSWRLKTLEGDGRPPAHTCTLSNAGEGSSALPPYSRWQQLLTRSLCSDPPQHKRHRSRRSHLIAGTVVFHLLQPTHLLLRRHRSSLPRVRPHLLLLLLLSLLRVQQRRGWPQRLPSSPAAPAPARHKPEPLTLRGTRVVVVVAAAAVWRGTLSLWRAPASAAGAFSLPVLLVVSLIPPFLLSAAAPLAPRRR